MFHVKHIEPECGRVWQGGKGNYLYIKDIEIYSFKPEQMFCEIFRYSVMLDIC